MAVDKLVDSTQLDNNLTSVANAIRAKSGGTGQLVFPAGFVSEIGNIETGGSGEIDWNEFTTMTKPVDITLANSVTNIGSFTNFAKTLSAPEVTTITKNAFYNNRTIKGISLPKCTNIPTSAFQYCEELNSIDLSSAKTLGERVFWGCKKLKTVFLPECTTLGSYSFYDMGSLSGRVIVLPKVTSINYETFRQTPGAGLTVDLGSVCTGIGERAFYNMNTLGVIIMRYNGVLTVGSSGISSINSNTAVYVPSSQISAYEADSTWGTKGITFNAIEGSIYETQYADGTPIPTT